MPGDRAGRGLTPVRLLAAAGAAALVLGCGGGSGPPASPSPAPSASPSVSAVGSPAARGGRTASFAGGAGDPVRGTVTVTPATAGYTVRIVASGLVPGRAYALHLHRGRCVGRDTVLSRYELPPMPADASGRGSVTATVTNGPAADAGTVLHVHGSTVAGSDDYRRVECTPLPA